MAWTVTAEAAEFDEAVEWFRERFPVTQELADKLADYSRERAWTISGVAQLDIVLHVHESLLKAIANGTDFKEWQDAIESKLTDAWGRKNSARLETIYLNATQQSYNGGRWRQMTEPSVLRMRPYGLFDAVEDSRTTREICKPRSGTILPLSDPWFDANSPQLHHRCRSQIRSLTAREARRRGITQRPPEGAAPGPGFGKNPLGSAWQPKREDYPDDLFEEFQRKQANPPKPKRIKPAGKPKQPRRKKDARAPLVAEQKQFVDALNLDDGGRSARELLRKQVGDVLPLAVARDGANARLLASAQHDDKLDWFHADGAHTFGGDVWLRRSKLDAARRTARRLDELQGTSALPTLSEVDDADGLRVLLHEELHGFSRTTAVSYSGIGRVLEEVGTELAARAALKRAAPRIFLVNAERGQLLELDEYAGAYGDWIRSVRDIVSDAAGVSRARALGLIVQAHERGALAAGPKFTSATDHLGAFLDGLDVTPEQRQTIRDRLLSAHG